jgi:hypothetical protein
MFFFSFFFFWYTAKAQEVQVKKQGMSPQDSFPYGVTQDVFNSLINELDNMHEMFL